MTRAYGHLPCAPRAGVKRFGVPGSAGAPPPPKSSMRAYWPDVFNQGAASSCTGNATSAAIVMAEGARGVDLAPPSRRSIYFNGRAKYLHDAKLPFSQLTDGGAFIPDIIDALAHLGAPDETVCPYSDDPAVINTQPSFASYLSGLPRAGIEYHLVDATGDDRIEAVMSALADGMPVIFGTPVGQSFEASVGPTVIDVPAPNDPIVGSHCMVLGGYDATLSTLDGRPLFDVANSWGAEYRDNGWFQMTSAWLCSTLVSELYALGGWNAIR